MLCFLTSPPFEPLRAASVLRLSQKSLFLLLLASRRRIDEVSHLARRCSRKAGVVSIPWVPGYVPKHYTSNFKCPIPTISVMDSVSSSALLLCPVRALNVYLARSREWLDDIPVAISPHTPLWSCSSSGVRLDKVELTRWFVSLVSDFLSHEQLPEDVRIGPHQMRKLAASASKQAGQDEATVRKVMGFSSLAILRKNYHSEIPPLDTPCVLPGGTFIPAEYNYTSDSD